MGIEGSHFLAAIALGALATGAYILACLRYRQGDFTFLDGLLAVVIWAMASAIGYPVVSKASNQAKGSALDQTLYTLRMQIQKYRIEHGGRSPVLFEGTLPQLLESTNGEGEPGPAGKNHPYGPYLPAGIPPNPYTGVNVVTAASTNPPTAPSGVGGWLYHEPTGLIWPDLPGYFD
ncbi:MAG TPA: hypothetical protein PK777_03630 [Thermoguttaceae bacterium]|nr:hypothetical protein [Thermoguttaceae bacterium]HPP52018.1 hypothetical protein [Thermoguttaceae bacterium]